MAPYREFRGEAHQQGYSLVEVRPNCNIDIVPVIPVDCRVRTYWRRERQQWLRCFEKLSKRARVVRAGADDPFRPMQFLTHCAAVKRGIPTIFVGPDMDVFESTRAALQSERNPLRQTILYSRMIKSHRAVCYGARTANLTLLKEGPVYERYAPHAKVARGFCHTMHNLSDLVDKDVLQARLATLDEKRPLHLGYCGRLIARKGVSDSISIIAEAKQRGVHLRYSIIGDGPEEEALREHLENMGLGQQVSIEKSMPYSEIKTRFREFDALLFTPLSEDTPRMLFDAYAAGVPTIGYAIPNLTHRAKQGEPVITAPIGDRDQVVNILQELDRDRERLKELAVSARLFGEYHSTENWYKRRAEWTLEFCS